MKITTNMKGFQQWMKAHPKKNLAGYFSIGDRELTHNEVVKIVNYAVEKGYRTDADIPSEELAKLLEDEE
jgi:hypothetical protein